jgi:hypothetical protein
MEDNMNHKKFAKLFGFTGEYKDNDGSWKPFSDDITFYGWDTLEMRREMLLVAYSRCVNDPEEYRSMKLVLREAPVFINCQSCGRPLTDTRFPFCNGDVCVYGNLLSMSV